MGPDSSCFSILLMVLEPVLNKFGTKTVSELVLKTFGHKKVSEPVSKQIGYQKSLWIDLRTLLVPIKNLVIRQIWSWSRDFLVSLLSHLTISPFVSFPHISASQFFVSEFWCWLGIRLGLIRFQGLFRMVSGPSRNKLVLEKVFEQDFEKNLVPEKSWNRNCLCFVTTLLIYPFKWCQSLHRIKACCAM